METYINERITLLQSTISKGFTSTYSIGKVHGQLIAYENISIQLHYDGLISDQDHLAHIDNIGKCLDLLKSQL